MLVLEMANIRKLMSTTRMREIVQNLIKHDEIDNKKLATYYVSSTMEK